MEVDVVNDKALNIKIPQELYDKLKQEAERKHISLASLVRLIRSEYFEKQAYKASTRPPHHRDYECFNPDKEISV